MSRSLRLVALLCALTAAPAEALAQSVPIALGDAVEGELAVAGERAVYAFAATRGQTVSVDRTASSNANGLNWALTDAWGRTIASDYAALNDLGPVPLLGGDYTITVTGEGDATGTFAFTVVDATPVTEETAIGATLDAAVTVPGQRRHYTFTATEGQALYVDQTASSNYHALDWRLVDPYGRELQPWTANIGDIGRFLLSAGTHTLSVRGEGDATGTFTATLVAPADGGGPIAIDADVEGELTAPGQRDVWTFTAAAGDRVTLDQTATSNVWGLNWSLESAAGRVLLGRTTDIRDAGPFVLDAGEHTLTVTGEGDALGTYAFRLRPVVDGAQAIAIDEVVTGAIEVAGQRRVYTFDAAPGTVVTLDRLATSNNGGINWSLVDENGRAVVARTANLNDIERVTLAGGAYTLTLFGEADATGTYELRVATVTDDVGPIAVGGAAAGALDVPGDTDTWTFTAAPGQVVTLDQTAASNVGGLNWTLLDALGRPVVRRTNNLNDVGPVALQGGAYTLRVLAEYQVTGTYEFTLVDGGSATFTPTGDPIALGDVVAGSIDAAGEVDRYTLTLAADTRVFVDLRAGARFLTWTLFDGVGQPVFGPTEARYPDGQDQGPWTLAAGTYTLELYHADDGTTPYELAVVGVVDEAGAFALEEVVTGALATPGATHVWTVALPGTTRVFLDLQAGGTRLYWTLTDPAGGTVFGRTRARYVTGEDRGPWTLAAGVYTLTIDADRHDTPAYQFQLRTVTDETIAAAVGDEVTGTFTEPGERRVVTFDVAPGERVHLDLRQGSPDLFWTLEDALGTTVFADVQARYATSHDQGPFVLPPGTTRLTLDPRNDALPAYTFAILAVADPEASIAVGDVVSDTITTPGATHRYRFGLAAPTRLYADVRTGANDTFWTLEDADGRAVFRDAQLRFADQRGDQGPWTLPAGDYEVSVRSDALPTFAFQLVAVSDTEGTLPPGTATPGAIATAGAIATYTFDVDQDGRTVVLDLQEGAADLTWSAYDEVGAALFTGAAAENPAFDDRGPFDLAAGRYTVVFDGAHGTTPTFVVQAFRYDPPPPGDCAAGAEPTPERCDGVDNDCDGLVDEEDYGNWDLYQGGAFLGPVTTLETFETVQVFYSYGIGFGSSYNGATLPPVSQESLAFVHRNLLDDELSLVFVHDQPNDGDGGRVNFTVQNMGLRAYVAQADDPGEISDNDFDGLGNAYFQWDWLTCCTDGVAIADIDWAQCITVIPEFLEGIEAWSYLTDDADDPRRIPLDLVAPLSICPSTCAACPPLDAAGGQVPTPVDLSPASGAALPAGSTVVLSGRVPAYPTRPIRGVIVDGAPARVDASGRFWAPVTVAAGETALTLEVVERCGVSTSTVLVVGETPDAAATLQDVSTRLAAAYRDTTWNEAAGRLFADVRARASGDDAVVGAALMEIGPQLDPSIALEAPDGETAAGRPYVALLGEGATLAPGETTDWRALSFVDPERLPVRYEERWLARANRAPVFATAPPVVATSTRPWRYDAAAPDPDGHAVSWALDGAPVGMQVDATSGAVTWSPGAADVGRHEVALAAADGFGGRTVQRFTLTVEDGAANRPPVFTTAPVVQAPIGAAYAYDADARDEDGDALSFRLDAGPPDAAVDAVSGLVTWPFALPGTHTLSVVVEDGRGGSARQTFVLAVGELPENPGAPQITSVPPTDAAVDDLWLYQAVGFDPDGDTLTWALGDEPAPPAGMEIDPFAGRLTWSPDVAQVGDHAVALTVSDGRGGVATQAFTVTVATEPANRPPYFASSPPLVAIAGQPWRYDAQAVDPEFGLVTYELVSGPAGMAVDATGGTVTWTPAVADAGTATVALRAEDAGGASGSQVFLLTVRETNRPPQLVTTPTEEALVGATWRYDAHATDGDGDPVTYTLAEGPAAATIDRASGLVLWDVTEADAGAHPLRLVAEDAWGGRDEQSWTVTVSVDTTPPTVRVVPTRTPGCLAEPLVVCVTAADDVGVVARSLAADGAPLAVDGAGCATVVRDAPAVVPFAGAASDASGNEGTDAVDVTFANCDDTEAPTVEVTAPAPGAVVSGPVEIVGTIADNEPDALTWTVSVARMGTDDFTVLAEGSGAVAEDAIAFFDPTALPNDSYRVQVLASDGLQTGGIEFRYGVGGEYKLGNLRVSFTDLLVPIAGVPLAVTRHYDSLDTTPGDFGAGWRLGLSGVVEDDVEETPDDDLAGLLGGEAFTRTSRVYVTKPDGSRVGFTFDPVQRGFPTLLWVIPQFRADEGVDDTLEVVDGPASVLDAGGRFYDFIIPYNPSTYRLTTPEGVQYTIDEERGLLHVEDTVGNTLAVTPEGVVSSTGVALVFERDEAGRITRVLEPDDDPDDGVPPADLQYDYDDRGNLAAFRDQSGNETSYHYENEDFPHHLTRIEDPLDRPVTRYVFGDDGRLLGACDADGDPVTLAGCETWEHDPVGGVSTLVSATGARTDLFYDERGNVVVERRWADDVAFEETTRLYDDDGRLLQTTNDAGDTWSYTWNARGHQTSATDPGGRTWTRTFGGCEVPESVCDPLGNCAWHTYDDACKLLAAEDALGGVTTYTYDDGGRVATITDAVGAVWSFAYDARGLPLAISDPDGDVETYEYDAAGNVAARTTRSGARIELTRDDQHRLVEERAVGAAPDGGDLVTTWTHDAAGNVSGMTSPVGDFALTRDANGRVATVTWPGPPDAPPVTLTYAYDADGRVVRLSDSLGGQTTWTWDGLGRVVAITQTGAGVDDKRIERDWVTKGVPGAVRRFADAEGLQPVATTAREYDCGACPSRVTAVRHRLPDDTPLHEITLVRDAASNVLEMTDAEGTHVYAVDGLRRLLSADHPDGGVQPDETYAWDAVGNLAASHRRGALSYAYEGGAGGSRLVADDRFDYEHDGVGNRTRRIDRATGETTDYDYDHRGNLTEVVVRAGDGAVLADASYAYGPNGRMLRADEDGVVTWYVYDGPNPILALAEDGSVRARRLYGRQMDELYAEEVAGRTRWFLRDHLGSVRDVVDDDGVVLAHFVYDSFGVPLAGGPLAGGAPPPTYTARPFSPVTGLGHFRARAYDPEVGRFLQPDPRPPWRYTYASGSPLLYIDPTGEVSAISYAKLAFWFAVACELAAVGSAGKGFVVFIMDIFEYVNDALSGYGGYGPPTFTPPMNPWSLLPCGLGEIPGWMGY